MNADSCPACRHTTITELGRVSVADIESGYKAPGLGIDVGHQFVGVAGPIRLLQCQACTLKWFSPTAVGTGDFYVQLQQHDWYYEQDKTEFGFAAQQVASSSSVLEVGCGKGAFHAHLPAGVAYRGLEFNEGAVRQAKAAGLDVEIRTLEQELADKGAVYDVVCHFQVLEHVPDVLGFMQSCAALLRPGGLLIVAVPADDSFVGLVGSSWLNMPPHHQTRWPDAALEQLLARVGAPRTHGWHEAVSAIHRGWHRATVVNAGWQALMGRGQGQAAGLLGRSPSLALRVAKRMPVVEAFLYKRGLQAHPQAARGHSVCMVGRKA